MDGWSNNVQSHWHFKVISLAVIVSPYIVCYILVVDMYFLPWAAANSWHHVSKYVGQIREEATVQYAFVTDILDKR